ncbi:hypothetical protein E2C01_049553 [Portunus trituberculatus]|uniref:Uncharacterized protein n=1 Tax=Portunus trituberculatus TaxID=210409 RepID=A0A5B7G5W7_PORTR|nr:hypothetical protein [Portunus trituberculatus]
MQVKRSSLSNLVFVRGNMDLLDYKEVQQQHKEKEEQDL